MLLASHFLSERLETALKLVKKQRTALEWFRTGEHKIRKYHFFCGVCDSPHNSLYALINHMEEHKDNSRLVRVGQRDDKTRFVSGRSDVERCLEDTLNNHFVTLRI